MHRAFWFNTDAGAYWSVIDDDDYSVVELADRFLQYMRFAKGSGRVDNPQVRRANRAVSPVLHGTIAGLVATDDHCFPYVVVSRMWLRIAPSPRHPHPVKRVWWGPGHPPARDNDRLNLICAVSEMFKFAAAEGIWIRRIWGSCSSWRGCVTAEDATAEATRPPL
jgi:integrase/recombinase XerD